MKDTKTNWLKAEKTKKLFEEALDEEKSKFNDLGIKRKSIAYAFNHFLENNFSKRPKTIKDYRRFYNELINAFNPGDPCTVLTKLSVEKWINEIKVLKNKKNDKPLKPNSVYGYYKQLHHFLNFLFEYNYIPMFVINRDVKPKPEKTEKITFSKNDLVKIFDGLEKKSSVFKAAIYILYYTGLRPSDILSFDRRKIDLDNRTIRYYSLKRKIYREVPFHPSLLPILQERINSTDEKIIPYSMTENLGRAFKRYLTELDLTDKKYTQYTFRKTFYTFARSNGIRDEIVRELVGHAQDTVGNIHYNAITLDDMKEELNLYPTIDSIRKEIKEKEASHSTRDHFYKLS